MTNHATLAAFERLSEAAALDQSLRVFDYYYHELHNEPAELRALVLDAVDEWLTTRL